MSLLPAKMPILDVQLGEYFAFDLSNTNEWTFMASRNHLSLSARFVVSQLVAKAQSGDGLAFALFIGRTPNMTLECQSFEVELSALRIDMGRTTLFFEQQYRLGRPIMSQLFVDAKKAAVMLQYMRSKVQAGLEPDPLILALDQTPEHVAPTAQ